MNRDLDFLDLISLFSFYISIKNYQENLKQTSNNELLKELQKQDDIINNQIIDKLKIIENQNNQILDFLKGENNGKL
nr:MAG TPA: hypothetical protein [Caudoviricetes sp.]